MSSTIPVTLFQVFGFPVTSTVVATWSAMALIVGLVLILRFIKPTLLEMIVDFISTMISDIMGTADVHDYLPLIGTMAILLVFLNLFGFFPVFSSPTGDLNTPIALALVVFVAVHFFGIKSKGFLGYLKDIASPIFLLPLEIVGQVSRTISLAVRLFGNILSGDLIVSIVLSLVPLLVPLPLMGLSFIIGILQAYIHSPRVGSQ